MSESKTYVFTPEGSGASGSGIMSMLAPFLSQRGIDPNVLLTMRNNNNGFGGEGGWFMWVIFLFFLMGWGGNGFGGFGNRGGLANEINNDYGRDLLMQAINGNGNAINSLASNLNCSVGQIQQAVNGVMSQVQSVGSQVGMSGQQIINAIQSGNCSIAQQLASCCCDVKTAIERQGYEGRLETLNQTNVLGGKIDNQTAFIGEKFCELKEREMQSRIDALMERNSTLLTQLSQEHQTAAIQQSQAAMIAPVNAALSDLSTRIAKMECNAPEVAKVPYSPVVGIPTCVAAQYGLLNGLNGGGFFGIV